MKIKHFLVSGLILLSLVFIGLQMIKFEVIASFVRVILISLLTVLYYNQVSTKHTNFLKFLITFLIADIIGLSYWFITLESESSIDYTYFICNGLYILSYVFLIIEVLKGMNIKDVITKLPAPIVILVVLDIFCVTIVTDTAGEDLTNYQYSMEFLYNAVIMTLLTLAVINYIYYVNKKAMNLLIGSIFIVFSEMIQLAYYYVLEINVLNVLCSLFLVFAFIFFYLQASLNYTENFSTYNEHLEA